MMFITGDTHGSFDAFYRDGDANVMIHLTAEYVDAILDEYLNVLSGK